FSPRLRYIGVSFGYQRRRADISTNCNFNFDLYIELDQASRDRLRIPLNSFGPLISLRLRSWRSSSVDDGSIRRSISRAANSDAFAALFARDPLRCVGFKPQLDKPKVASERVGLSLCLAAQASTRLRSSDESGMVVEASCPVVRRPLFVRPAICFPFFSSFDRAAIFSSCGIPPLGTMMFFEL